MKKRPSDLHPYTVTKTGRAQMYEVTDEIVKGRHRRVYFTGDTYEQANNRRLAWLDQTAGLDQEVPDMTLSEWMAHWLRVCNLGKSEATITTYEVRCRLHIAPAFGGVKLRDLTTEKIETRLSDIRETQTYNQTVKTLRSILNEAVARGHLTQNPAQGVKLRRIERAVDEVFTDDEVR